MPLSPGTRIGHYEIVAPLGAGGMGEVYRARDLTLGRDVALKVLPHAFALDRDRTARFAREAHVLASLNHPNIAAIYGFADSALALELVEGPTLADRIAPGPLPVDEAMAIARQIALALGAAHEQGIVHRDLKPANIVVRPDGTVKVLDFGLAKAIDAAAGTIDASQSPTITSPAVMTREGIVFGSAAYMSPEQARGKPVDHRADIWAFGVVLFETLTGTRPFRGETVSDTLAAVLKSEPSWDTLPPSTPATLRRVLRACLQKDPKARLQAIGDWQFLLEEASQPAVPARRRWVTIAATLAAAIGGLALGVTVVYLRGPAAPAVRSSVVRLTATLPPGVEVDHRVTPALALSPDGTRLVYVGRRAGAAAQLFLRSLEGSAATSISGTDGAQNPFFSPNGDWIGFFAQGKLKKVSTTGGASQTLCDAPSGQGGHWAADDTIYFVPFNTSGVWKVPAAGGAPQEVTTVDRSKGEVSHRWPQMLPGGTALLFTVWLGPGWEEKSLQLQVMDTGERRMLTRGASTGRYLSTGHLVYNREGIQALMALPFDLATLRLTDGQAVELAERVWEGGAEGAQYAVSDAGTVAYVLSYPRRYERRLVWVDRSGKSEVLPAPSRPYYDPRISPDGSRLAVSAEEETERIWIYDFARPTLTALTTADSSSQSPAWTPDGTHVVYRGTRQGARNLYRKSADGSGDEERLTTSDNLQTPTALSPDGQHLAFVEVDRTTGQDALILSLDGSRRTVTPFLQTRATEVTGRFSPNGRWLAYTSNESGRDEIYVRPFPGTGGTAQVSTAGGGEPVWSRDGRELFYRSGEAVMAVPVSTEAAFAAGLPRRLFADHYERTGTGSGGYDVSLDGRRFLMIEPAEPELPVAQISVVLGWFDEVRQRIRQGPQSR
jgi:eukaryotic-like serine/threonine-protein kinase